VRLQVIFRAESAVVMVMRLSTFVSAGSCEEVMWRMVFAAPGERREREGW
jgi:hypothetical protein